MLSLGVAYALGGIHFSGDDCAPVAGAAGLRCVAVFCGGWLALPQAHEWARYGMPYVPSAAHARASSRPNGPREQAPDRHLVLFAAYFLLIIQG